MVLCQGCGKKFIPRRKDQIYCSNLCYNTSYRKVYEPIKIFGNAHIIERDDNGVQICQYDKTNSIFVLLSPKYPQKSTGRLRLEMEYYHLKFLVDRFASLGDSIVRFPRHYGQNLREVKDRLKQLEAYLQDRRLRTTYVSPRIKKQEKLLERWKILEQKILKKRMEQERQEKSESESEEREEEREAEEWEQDLEEEEDYAIIDDF